MALASLNAGFPTIAESLNGRLNDTLEQAMEEEEDQAAPLSPEVSWEHRQLVREARLTGRCWTEAYPAKVADLGAVYRARKESPHLRFPSIASGTLSETLYEEAWMVGALTTPGAEEENA